MWVDEHDGEVLDVPECRQLLRSAAGAGAHGHLGLPTTSSPVILPVNFAFVDHDIVVRVSRRLHDRMVGHLVAFLVDGRGPDDGDDGQPRLWSVLARGLASSGGDGEDVGSPVPEVPAASSLVVRIRTDRLTGRRFRPAPVGAAHR